MLEFLRGQLIETLDTFNGLNMYEKDYAVRTDTVITQTKLKIFNMMLKLPDVIKEAKDRIEYFDQKKDKFVESQEGGLL